MNANSPSVAKAQNLRSRLREATSAAIIDAAEGTFAERGLNTATMNEIAAAAGVAVGTLYNHFKDRDALLAALVEERRSALLEVMDEFLDQPSSGDFASDLKELVHRMGGFFDQHRRFHQILHQLESGLNTAQYPETAACSPKMRGELHLRLEKIVKRGVKTKALRPEFAEYYPTLLLGMLRSMRMRLLELGKLDERLPVDEIVRFFMHGAAV
ncbi:MAG: TetR family transcriptional regulator [Myxococcales bacterium]|nr:TetR family transcriptional regulator [Myxococcales bacterium]